MTRKRTKFCLSWPNKTLKIRSGYSYGTRTATCICYSYGSQKISWDFSVIPDPQLVYGRFDTKSFRYKSFRYKSKSFRYKSKVVSIQIKSRFDTNQKSFRYKSKVVSIQIKSRFHTTSIYLNYSFDSLKNLCCCFR